MVRSNSSAVGRKAGKVRLLEVEGMRNAEAVQRVKVGVRLLVGWLNLIDWMIGRMNERTNE